jgi:ubiquinone biosynthesis protein
MLPHSWRPPARHRERYREVAGVLAAEGLGWLVEVTGLSKFASKRALKRRRPDEITPERHIRHAIERLGVTFIKGGQALSTRTDILPPALAGELARLQDEVTAEPFETMRTVVEAELGMPIDEAFATFEAVPLGAASIGQVYSATLPDGTAVAVKVQRPGVCDSAEVDLEITMALARTAQGRLPDSIDLDLVGLATEFTDAVRGEFDYVREARNAERLRKAFEGDETVVFPRVYWTHTTPRVLTLELLEGVRMNHTPALDAAGYDRPALARNGINAYLHMIFDLGFFHADPHPGNFIALPGDKVGFTDFGRVGVMSAESRARFIDLLEAVVDRDEQAAADTLIELSSGRDVDEESLENDVGRLISRYYGRELGRINATDLFGDTLTLFRDHRLNVPNDFAVALATLAVLEGVGMALDPEFEFAFAVAPFVARAVKARLRPAELVDRLGLDARRGARMLERLPVTLDRILRRAARGEFRFEVAPRDYQRPLDKIAELVNRLAFAIVVAALIVGASTLLSAASVPPWLKLVGQIGLVAALVVSIWFFGSIISARYRAGKRR